MEDKIKILEEWLLLPYVSYYLCLGIPEIKYSKNKLQTLKEFKLIEALKLCNGITAIDRDIPTNVEAFIPTLDEKKGLVDAETYNREDVKTIVNPTLYREWKIEIVKEAIDLLKGTVYKGDTIEFNLSCNADRKLYKGVVEYTDAMGLIVMDAEHENVFFEVKKLVNIKILKRGR